VEQFWSAVLQYTSAVRTRVKVQFTSEFPDVFGEIQFSNDYGICNYLPDFSLSLVLFMRAHAVCVRINEVTAFRALYGCLAPLVSGSFAHAKPC